MPERARMTERDLTGQVRDLLRVLGAWEVKHRAGLGDRRGIPDILACLCGRFVAIELKAAKGRVTPDQERELASIREAGGVAFVARSLEDVLDGLREVDSDITDRVKV